MSTYEEVEKAVEIIDDSEMEGKYLTFWTEKQLFGIPIADVVQIIQMQPITPIPEYPYFSKGIINLRGNIIPVIDIRLRFNKPEETYNEHTCIIVTSIKERLVGFIVDGVEEVTDIPPEEISPPPSMSSDHVNEYLTGIGRHNNKIVLLLDAHKILSEDQLGALA